MAKNKEQTKQWPKTMTNRQTMVDKTLQRKLKQKIEQHDPTTNRDEPSCFVRVNSSYYTCDTRRVTIKRHEHHLI